MDKPIEMQGIKNSSDMEIYLESNIEEAIHAREVCERIALVLKTATQREVFSRLLDGLTQAEIAKELELSRSRIGQLIFKIRMTTISVLEELEGKDFSHLGVRERTPKEHIAFLRRNGIERES